MSFGSDLEREYLKLAALTPSPKFRIKGELFLVDCLKNATMNVAGMNNITVDVIHGKPSMTQFKVASCGCTVSNELGDILFFVYDGARREGRMLVMQNKLERTYNLASQAFYSNPRQTCLMSGGGLITYCPLPFITDAVLHDKIEPPLCCYGIFYEQNEYQLFYSPIDEIQYISPVRLWCKQAYRKTTHKNRSCVNSIRTTYRHKDKYSRNSVEKFGDSLVSLLLGKPIDYSSYKAIVQYFNPKQLPQGFLDLYGNDYPRTYSNVEQTRSFHIPYILFLDVTGCEKKDNYSQY